MSPAWTLTVVTLTYTLLSWSPPLVIATTITEAPCPPGYFTCETDYCIPNSFLCDGDTDCPGGSDEQDCPTTDPTTPVYTTPSSTGNTKPPSTTSTTTPGIDCVLPFQSVDGRCVFVDPFVAGNWQEMKYRCSELGAVMLEIEDPNFLLSIVQLIGDNGIESTNYWIAGRTDGDDGVFYWDGSRTNVTMGTPIWALYYLSIDTYTQEPRYLDEEQCVLLNKDRKLFMSAMDCDEVAGVICQREPDATGLASPCSPGNFACDSSTCISSTSFCDGVTNCCNNADEAYCQHSHSPATLSMSCLGGMFECGSGYCINPSLVCDGFEDCSDGLDERDCSETTTTMLPSTTTITTSTTQLPSTSSSTTTSATTTTETEECSLSPPYHLVGGKCIFVEPFVVGSWEQMSDRCEEFGGVLLEVEDPNFFLALVEYIVENGIESRDYWTGGRKDYAGDVYYWDGSRTNLTMGTPFWSIYEVTSNSPYGQEPYSTPLSQCVMLNNRRMLYFDAEDCDDTAAGFICQRPQDEHNWNNDSN